MDGVGSKWPQEERNKARRKREETAEEEETKREGKEGSYGSTPSKWPPARKVQKQLPEKQSRRAKTC